MSETTNSRPPRTGNGGVWGWRAAKRPIRRLGVAVGLVGLLLTAACGGSGGNASSAAAANKTVVALLPETTDNTFSAAFVRRLEALAAQQRINLKIFNAKYDAATQASQATTALAQKPAAMMLWPANPGGARTILLQAKRAGVPVQIENSALKESDAPSELYQSYVGPDNVKVGELQADMTNKALGGRGRVVMIEGQPANSVNTDRIEGYRNKLAQIAPNIHILDSQPGFWEQPKSQSVMAEFLTRFHGDINAVYTSDDIAAAGAVQALQAANIPKGQIKVLSAGGNKLGLPLVEQGWVYGTVFQSPNQEADLAIPTIVKISNGEPVERTHYVELPEVTADNVKQYTAQW